MSNSFNKETKLCVSISSTPGNIGATIHNEAYNYLGLNFVYLPLKPKDAKSAIAAVRSLNIRGCSVSMPFKEEVMKYIDTMSQEAEKIGAINTIVNDLGVLKGYNTDYDSVLWSFKKLKAPKTCKVLILGHGGMGKACLASSLHFFDTPPYIAIRNRQKYTNKKLNFVSWKDIDNLNIDLVINATPIGMFPNIKKSPINENILKNIKYVIDVVASPINSQLILDCKKLGLKFIKGQDLAVMQAARQFYLYTDVQAPLKLMKDRLKFLT